MKQLLSEARFDFRGGRVTSISPDLLNSNELVDATNCRIDSKYGAVTKRTGCQRLHQTAAPAAIKGVVQWDGPSGKQLVKIANGHLYYRNGFTLATAFTDEGTAPFSTTVPAFFMPFRDATSGAPLVLFIASGGKLFKWTGTVLTDITGTTTAADRIIAYHTRAFARNVNYKKTIFWGKVGDATVFTTGTKTDGGSALVNVLNGEEIIALEVIGSSLLMAAEDSVMRFTGHATDDIVISQDTEGISSEVGAVGPQALKRFENVAAMLNERGPYVVTETAVEPIGEQVLTDFDALDTTVLSSSVVSWNRGRKELMFCVPGSGDSSLNKTVYTQSVRLQAWQGPWNYSFGITCGARYEDTNGDEFWITGGNDGFLRHMDIGAKDDVLYDGTGGSNITMVAELPPLHFGRPGSQKVLSHMKLQAILPVGNNLTAGVAFDNAAFDNGYFVNAITDGILRDYRVDLDGYGYRLRTKFTDSSAVSPTIYGLRVNAYDMGRP